MNSLLAGGIFLLAGSARLSVLFNGRARRVYAGTRPKSYRKSSFFKLELAGVGVAGLLLLLFGLAIILSEFTPPGH